MFKILYKYYHPKNKEIFIDNHDINDLSLETIRRNITYISQNENMAKLRHDYINQITVVNALAVTDPQKAIELLDNMRKEYKERTQI